eukprot:545543_1
MNGSLLSHYVMVLVCTIYWILTELFRKMKIILDEMYGNYEPEYHQYTQIQGDKKQISHELIIDTLQECLSNPSNNNDNNDADGPIHLETDLDSQVIGGIQNGKHAFIKLGKLIINKKLIKNMKFISKHLWLFEGSYAAPIRTP